MSVNYYLVSDIRREAIHVTTAGIGYMRHWWDIEPRYRTIPSKDALVAAGLCPDQVDILLEFAGDHEGVFPVAVPIYEHFPMEAWDIVGQTQNYKVRDCMGNVSDKLLWQCH